MGKKGSEILVDNILATNDLLFELKDGQCLDHENMWYAQLLDEGSNKFCKCGHGNYSHDGYVCLGNGCQCETFDEVRS